MKLYYAAKTRATRPRWMLEEIGAPYEIVRLSLSKGEHKTPEYLKIHPHGAVPALVDGDVTIFESAAIIAYLADKYPEKHLAPPAGSPARGPYYQWLIYSMATEEPPVFKFFLNTILLPEDKRSPALVQEARDQWAAVGKVLDDAVASTPYILGDHFSAADIMISSISNWAGALKLNDPFPALKAYGARCAGRPAFQRAIAD